jgi:multiple sugar transport system permease protein
MMLPVFLLMRNLRLLDTYWSLIFVYTVFNLPFSVWMLRAFFEEIPYEIDECALIDGCSHLRILFKILLPIAKTGVITTAIFCSIFSWNEFLMAAILTRRTTNTFIVYAASYKSAQNLNFGEIASVIVIGAIPIIILFLLTKKQFVKGISWGAVKE